MAAADDDAPHGQSGEALRTAASAALAGAAVAAAHAFAQRRQAEADDHVTDKAEAPSPTPHTALPDDEEPEPSPVAESEPEQTVRESPSPSETRRIVERAREQLRDLRGADAESVSSIRRTPDGWRIGLDVVEVHRIPESTDVLATYELDLDDDGNLITFERAARYSRSEADRH
jgi:hypothetical protein